MGVCWKGGGGGREPLFPQVWLPTRMTTPGQCSPVYVIEGGLAQCHLRHHHRRSAAKKAHRKQGRHAYLCTEEALYWRWTVKCGDRRCEESAGASTHRYIYTVKLAWIKEFKMTGKLAWKKDLADVRRRLWGQVELGGSGKSIIWFRQIATRARIILSLQTFGFNFKTRHDIRMVGMYKFNGHFLSIY